MTQFKAIAGLLILLVIVGLGAIAYRYKAMASEERGARRVAEINLKAAADENNKLVKHIDDLDAQARINDAIALDLANRLAELHVEQVETEQELSELKAKVPDVKNFLSLPVPVDLRRVLNKAAGIKDRALDQPAGTNPGNAPAPLP